MEVPTLKVAYTAIDTLQEVHSFLQTLPKLIALDFEAKSHLAFSGAVLPPPTDDATFEERRVYRQASTSNALSHPIYIRPTHLAVATSSTEATVILLRDPDILNYVMEWLVSTPRRQVWHNATYDLTLIFHHTQRLPRYFEDTMLMAKSLLNDCNNAKSNVKLKYLKGYKYGRWAVSPDSFETVADDDPTFLEYAATDACATFDLYQDILSFTEPNYDNL